MSGITLSYNGYSAFDLVEVHEIVELPNVSPGVRATRGITRHRASGIAIIRVTDKETTPVGTLIKNLQAKFAKQGADLVISISDGTSYDIVNISGGDDLTGPYPELTVRHVNGTNSITVIWAFEWHRTDAAVGDTAASKLLEFVMAVEFDIDDIGNTTMTKRGHVIIRKSSAAATMPPANYPTAPAEGTRTAGIGYAATKESTDIVKDYFDPTGFEYPEHYRRLVEGNLLRGWRPISRKYATDESRTKMSFIIVCRDFNRGPPNPVRAGDVEFTFEQSMPTAKGADSSLLGIKTFRARLEGPNWMQPATATNPTDVPTLGSPVAVTPADLLLVAIRMSQRRIVWGKSTAADGDLILSITVREIDMLNRNAIEFTVVAACKAAVNYASGQSQPYKHSLWLQDILGNVTITGAGGTGGAAGDIVLQFVPTSMPDAYGDFGIFRIVPSHYDAQQSAGSQTWKTTEVIAAASKQNALYILPDAVFTNVIEVSSKKVHAGLHERTNLKNSAASATPYTSTKVRRAHVTPDTGMVVIPSQSLAGADLDIQGNKPAAYIYEEVLSTRLNARVEKDYAALETGYVVMRNDFFEDNGAQDANGNRIFSGLHIRAYRMKDPGGSGGNNFFNSSGRRQWAPFATASGVENIVPELASSGTCTAPGTSSQSYPLNLGTPDAWA